MNFNNLNTKERDLSNVQTQTYPEIPQGWNKIALTEVGPKTEEKSGAAHGALFTFKIVEGTGSGLTFKKWYGVQAIKTEAKWRQTQFENTMIRIAQCVNVDVLNNVAQLINKPFYAFLSVTEREYESKETDREGNFLKKKTTDVEFAKGLLTENLLSCEEYAKREEADAALALDNPF
ncbi:MAG: hypothetical protein IK077_14920 [Thermoguttaceae bacterium]|nr:hypothetical protein [Thermoguttaceae bacterium]